ncbi:hypothetical protein GQ457_16G024110 [Hibiscus cannabinus]
MQASSTYNREMFAITQAVKKWRQYLLGRKFVILTDQKSLRELTQQTIQTPEQQQWLSKLLGYDFEIRYRPGKLNSTADALSRKTDATLMAFSRVVYGIVEDIRRASRQDNELCEILEHLQNGTDASTGFSDNEGLILMKGCIVGSSKHDQLGRELLDRDAMLRELRRNLERAQARMKDQADKHRRELELEEGKCVFVRLQPYRQISLRQRRQQKTWSAGECQEIVAPNLEDKVPEFWEGNVTSDVEKDATTTSQLRERAAKNDSATNLSKKRQGTREKRAPKFLTDFVCY